MLVCMIYLYLTVPVEDCCMMKLIPRVLDDYLPFTPESLISWNSTTDILQFLYTLYDKPAVIISHDGKRTHSNYRSYGKYVYDEGQK